MTIRRYATTAQGGRDGTSWSDVSAFEQISADVQQAVAGDAFLIGFDRDRERPVFWQDTKIALAKSGTIEKFIRVAAGYVSQPDNVQPSGQSVNFRFSDELPPLRTSSQRSGPPFIVLTDDASQLEISGFGFFGAPRDGFISLGANDETEEAFANLVIRDLSGSFAGRVIEARERVAVDGLVVADCDAYGLTRGFARFWRLSNARFRNLYLDAGGVDAGGTSVCQIIHIMKGTNVVFENVFVSNAVNGLDAGERGSDYVQGDGIVTERETTGFEFRNCHARGMGDGGFDLKTSDFLMEDCSTSGCKKGVRIWSRSRNVMRRCSFTNPRTIAEQASALWCAGTAELIDCRLQAGRDSAIVRFTNDPAGVPELTVRGGEIRLDDGAALIQGDAGTLILDEVLVNGELRTETINSPGGVVR